MSKRSNEYRDDADEETGGPGLDFVLAVARRRWRLIAAVALVAVVASVALAYLLPIRYEASAVVQIDPRRKSIANIDPVIADIKADTATIESEVEILRSRAIALKVIDALGLRPKLEADANTWWVRLARALSMRSEPHRKPRTAVSIDNLVVPQPGAREPERDPAVTAFLDTIRVQRVRVTLLIEIKVTADDPVMAARIANAMAEVYLASQLEAKAKANSMATGLLEEKLDSLRKRVGEAERRVEQYKALHRIFDAEGQSLAEKQLARMMEQTVLARNTTAEARAKYELAQKLMRAGDGGTTLVEVLQNATVRQLKEQAAAVSRREAELMTKYGPKHPEIQKVRAELHEAQAHLRREIERVVENLRNEYEVANGREKDLAASLAAMKSQQVADKDAGVDLKEFEREAATSKQLFEALLARYKQTSETQGLQLPDAHIVERADVPIYPSAPKRKLILLFGLFGGMCLGGAIALALELLADGVGRPEDVERELDLAHLTSLPRLATSGAMFVDPMRTVRQIVADPGGAFAEAIRGARREIDIKGQVGAPRVVLVASSLPNEGSGIVASNLAHHYGLSGRRVLLIDGDLRRSTLTRQLAPQRMTGLVEALVTGAPVERAILRDATTGLHFLAASGPAPVAASPPELLESRVMTEAIARLKSQFDTIVIDAPPLLPVVDGRILADLADQIVLVMVWRRTPKQLARKALNALGRNKSKIAGVIVAEVDPAAIADDRGLGYTASDRLDRAA